VPIKDAAMPAEWKTWNKKKQFLPSDNNLFTQIGQCLVV